MTKEKGFKQLKLWQRAFIIIGAVLFAIGLIIGALCIDVAIFRKSYYAPIAENVTLQNAEAEQPLVAVGRGIYDCNGRRVQLKGVNFGNWFLQEGWMSVNSVGASLNADGSFVKVNEEGIVEQYEETYQDELDEMMRNNPNLTQAQIEELWNVYYDNFIQEEDFVNIKNLGMNTIRLPMYYRNFMEGTDDEHLVMKSEPFKRLDWFLEMCKKHGLYAILDMHGVVGGQSGFEHSGTRKIDFWKNEVYQQEMCDLWTNIALHYKNQRPDLAQTIAAYDLVNEPIDRNTPNTTLRQCRVLDKLYKAIRKVDSKHIISIGCCWYFYAFPNPQKFGWENVMYQAHLYNIVNQYISNDFFYWTQDLTFSFHPYNVPYYIGEFTFYGDKDEWVKWLDEYDNRGFNWTIWTYKCTSVGWWDNSWGLYVYKMNLKDNKLKLDLRTATYDEIYEVWSHVGTSEAYTSTGVTMEAMKIHFGK